MKKVRILFIEDNEDDFALILREIKKAPFEIEYSLVENEKGFETEIKNKWDIIISDYSLPGFNGYEALKICNKKGIDTPFIVVSGTVGEDIAVDMMKSGAKDYIMKKDMARLVPAIERELEDAKIRKKSKYIALEREVLFTISHDMMEASSLDELLNKIYSNIKKVINVENCFIALYDSKNDEIYFPFFVDKFDSKPAPMRKRKSLTDYVLQTGQSLICDEEDFAAFSRKNGIEAIGTQAVSWLGVPFVIKTKPIGVLVVQSYEKGIKYNENDKNFLEAIANDIALAIERKLFVDALTESEYRFKILAEVAPVGIFRTDEKGVTNYVNPKWCKISKMKYEDAMGDGWLNCVHPEDRELLARNWQKAITSKSESYAEYRFIYKDGSVAWVIGRAVPQKDEKGKIIGYIGTTTDITERKLTEEALRKSEERYRVFINSTADMAFLKDDKFKYVLVNKANADYFGKGMNEIIGKTDFDLMPDFAAKNCRISDTKALNSDSVVIEEEKIDNNIYETTKFKVPLAEGKFGIGGYIKDITERKNSDDLLKKTLAQQNLILNSQLIIFYTSSAESNYRTTWISEQVKKVTGFAPERFIEDSNFWAERIHPDDKQKSLNDYSSVIKNGSVETEYRWECSDGKYRWFIDKITVTYDNNGKPKEILGIWLDITDRKQVEQNLLISQKRLKEAQRIGKIGNWEWFPSENIVNWSDELYDIFGIEKGKIITTEDSISVFHPDDRENIIQLTKKALEQKVGSSIECRIIRPDGEIKYVYGSGEMLLDESGNIDKMIGIYQDITDRKLAEESLRKSEERFKLASLATNDVIYDWDLIKETGWFSENYFKVFGYKQQNVTFSDWKKNIFPDDLEKVLAVTVPVIFKGGKTWICEYRLKRSDGSYAYVIDSGYVIRDDSGKAVRLIGSIMDFTERKWAEDNLRKSEEHYRSLLTAIPDMMFRLNSKGRFIDYHAEDESLLFAPPEKFIGKNIDDILPAYIAEKYQLSIKEAKRTGEVKKFEYEMELRNGKTCYYEARITCFDTECVSIVRDITNKHNAEKSMVESEERYRKIFEESPFGIVLVDSNLNFIKVNSEFCRLTGYSEKELISKSFKRITHPEHLEQDILNIRKLINGEIQVYNTEKRYIKKDGSIVWGELSVSVVKNYEGKFLYLLAMIEDISARKFAEEAVKESEEHFRNIVRNAEAAYFRINIDGIFEDVNKSWLKIHKYSSPDEIIGKHFSITQADVNLATGIINELLKGKPIETGEISRKCKDGSIGYHTFSISPVLNNGKISGVEGFLIDITEQKTALQELKESQERYKILIETMNEGVILADNDDVIQFVNRRECEIFGYEPEELIGQINNKLLIYEEDRHILIEKNKARLKSISDSYDIRGVKKTGEIIWLNINGAPVKDRDGNVIGSVGLVSDITERKISEENLIKLSRAVEQSPASIVITDLKGDIEYVNPKFVDITGYIPEEVVGRNPRILKSGEKPSGEYKELWNTISSGKDWFGEFRNKRKNGELFWESASISPIRNTEGVITHFIAIKEDITEKKEKELELIKAKEKAVESERLKSSFLANMSHELRTPMVGILGFAELMKNIAENSELQDFADNISKSGKRLLETLNLILDLSRIEAGRVEVKTGEVNIVKLASEVYTNYLNEADKKNIKLSFKYSEDIIIAKIDERMIFESINNLVNNAFKFTKSGEIKIEVSSDKKNEYAKIKISDTGIGIEKENLKVIFDEFRQASEGYSRSFEGTGLGLTITKNFVEKNGGNILVESELGVGTSFTIELPLINTGKKTDFKEEISDSIEKEDLEISKDVSILCVDDDSFTREYLEYILKDKYNLSFAENGISAIELSKTKKFAMILMDINLGKGMDGVETARKIRKLSGYENIPVIAMTAFAMKGDKEEFIRDGMTDYISKPFKSIDLINLVESNIKNK